MTLRLGIWIGHFERERANKEDASLSARCWCEGHGRMVAGTGRDAVVVVHVGTNDVMNVRSEELVARYKDLLNRFKESGRNCVLTGHCVDVLTGHCVDVLTWHCVDRALC